MLEWHNNYNLPQKYTNNKSHHHYKYSATLLNKKPVVYPRKNINKPKIFLLSSI